MSQQDNKPSMADLALPFEKTEKLDKLSAIKTERDLVLKNLEGLEQQESSIMKEIQELDKKLESQKKVTSPLFVEVLRDVWLECYPPIHVYDVQMWRYGQPAETLDSVSKNKIRKRFVKEGLPIPEEWASDEEDEYDDGYPGGPCDHTVGSDDDNGNGS